MYRPPIVAQYGAATSEPRRTAPTPAPRRTNGNILDLRVGSRSLR
jgi:hypothetical protein